MRKLLTLMLALFSSFAQAEMIEPDAQITLRKIDPLTGRVKWSVPFPRQLRPYRCEAYTGKIVVYWYPMNRFQSGEPDKHPKSEMAFLDSRTGQKVTPFDTRDFVLRDDDPQIARSRYGSQGSVLDERGELRLPNGWVSYGVAGLPWWNCCSNSIYFFDWHNHRELKWSMTLPEGAYNLSNWNNLLVFRKSTEKEQKLVDTLYTQPAGRDSPIWEFTLPADVPDREVYAPDVPGQPKIVRDFTYMVGQREIFVFGNGTLFALEPSTGKTQWRSTVSSDPVIKQNSVRFDYADVLEIGDNLMLCSGGVLARFDKASRSVGAVMRKDLYDGPLPISCDGFIYCFTQHR